MSAALCYECLGDGTANDTQCGMCRGAGEFTIAPSTNGVPITVAIVGCGKSKLAEPARARDMYTGPLFRAARAYAEEFDEWRIASARYGLLRPEQIIRPYNDKLKPKDAPQWANGIASGIVRELLGCGPYKILLLAGADYTAPIRQAFECGPFGGRRDENCIEISEPLLGLGLGRRLQWFAKAWQLETPRGTP